MMNNYEQVSETGIIKPFTLPPASFSGVDPSGEEYELMFTKDVKVYLMGSNATHTLKRQLPNLEAMVLENETRKAVFTAIREKGFMTTLNLDAASTVHCYLKEDFLRMVKGEFSHLLSSEDSGEWLKTKRSCEETAAVIDALVGYYIPNRADWSRLCHPRAPKRPEHTIIKGKPKLELTRPGEDWKLRQCPLIPSFLAVTSAELDELVSGLP